MSTHEYRGMRPSIDASSFVAPTAAVIGDVVIGARSSIWFGAVLRGDAMAIRIGARTSIQDNAVVHATTGWAATTVGDDCTVGHGVILHGCTVGDRVLVGMGSIVLDGAEIGADTILGAGSLVTARTTIPPGVLALGRPAKVIRALNDDELASIRAAAETYVGLVRDYLDG